MFTGTYTALVTPFNNGHVDEAALQRLVQAQIAGGVDGIVPMGSTGESPTLSFEEHIRVIEQTVKFAAGKVKVLAGTGANSTTEAITLTEAAAKAGAHGCLHVAPYYNKPTQEGLFQHFKTIAKLVSIPIVLYNIPGRCGVEISIDTIYRLNCECSNIVGIKEAGGNVDRVSQMRVTLGNRFTILSGDDSLTLPFMAVGADGVISVASNIIPRELSAMVKAAALGQWATAQKLHLQYFQLFRDLFIETNPGPVKAALALMGQIREEYRLPLVPLAAKNRELLRATLLKYGLIK
jgi:4-hydroxy-tetrahydrodipicolinate synthase